MSKKAIIVTGVVVIVIAGAWYVLAHRGVSGVAQNTGAQSEKTIEAKTDFYDITAKYPVEPLDKEGVMAQFVNQQVAQREEDWKTGGEAYNQEKDVEKQFPDRPKMVYTLDITYQKFTSSVRGTVSYLFTIGEYTGGANGDEKVQAFTFDKNGLVDIQSILNLAGYDAATSTKDMGNDLALSYALLDKAKADPDMFPELDMVRDGLGLSYLKADGVTLDHTKCKCDGWLYASNLQNFAVTDQGMTFYFDKYAITIGAAGISHIALDWADLRPYLATSSASGT